jgi:LDH2 family malate/lactate/ureidoglycolate dehydrogenase
VAQDRVRLTAAEAQSVAVLPEGVAIDAEGQLTRDPAQVHAILPFGGYKGFGLAPAMQALGVFAGSRFAADQTYGYLVVAMQREGIEIDRTIYDALLAMPQGRIG